MDVFLERKDPIKKTIKPRVPQGATAPKVEKVGDRRGAEKSSSTGPLTPSTRNAVLKNSGGRCEYREPATGRRCEGRHLLEVDHIQPRALGGTHEPGNLRALCRTHNLMMAERSFGREKIEAFRVKP
jgi:hypothetical protein